MKDRIATLGDVRDGSLQKQIIQEAAIIASEIKAMLPDMEDLARHMGNAGELIRANSRHSGESMSKSDQAILKQAELLHMLLANAYGSVKAARAQIGYAESILNNHE